MSESAAGLTVTPAELVPDAAIDAVLGAVTEASRCWCRWWILANADYATTDPQSRRAALDGDRAADLSTGLIALRGEDAVGWVGVAPRPRYARLPRTKAITTAAGDTDWADEGVWSILGDHGAAFCISDHHDAPSPWRVTADFAYVRGHGPGGRYHGRYPEKDLAAWAAFLDQERKAGRDTYSYFDNDVKSAAPQDADILKSLVAP